MSLELALKQGDGLFGFGVEFRLCLMMHSALQAEPFRVTPGHALATPCIPWGSSTCPQARPFQSLPLILDRPHSRTAASSQAVK